jgi:hypothetical protein
MGKKTRYLLLLWEVISRVDFCQSLEMGVIEAVAMKVNLLPAKVNLSASAPVNFSKP